MNGQECIKCRFFFFSEYAFGAGACRRYPPVQQAVESRIEEIFSAQSDSSVTVTEHSGVQPKVSFGDWCGEFQQGRIAEEIAAYAARCATQCLEIAADCHNDDDVLASQRYRKESGYWETLAARYDKEAQDAT